MIDEHAAYPDDTDAVIAQALEAGKSVVYPGECEIQIDIDDFESSERFDNLWSMFVDVSGGASVKSRTPSKGGWPKEHITVLMPYPVTEWERLLLQAILGSDARRELFGYRRLKNGISPVGIFIEKGVPL